MRQVPSRGHDGRQLRHTHTDQNPVSSVQYARTSSRQRICWTSAERADKGNALVTAPLTGVVVAAGRKLRMSGHSPPLEAIVMRASVGRGRVYRRCACRDTHRHQMGAHCPHLLADGTHGTWGFAVDVPAPEHRRTTVRRGGFTNRDSAGEALRRFLEGEAGGFDADPNQTVAAYLNTWLAAKVLVLKPTTLARYREYVRNDLVPAFGTLKLDQLAHRHISAFVTSQLTAGRGRTTLYRCLATLSSALGDAVRQHRLPHNPASPPVLRRPPSPERRIWTAEEAARFLTHCHQTDPEMADLFEVLIDTGMRKGEALGLHWNDVHLDQGVLYVRCTLSAVDNQRLVITAEDPVEQRLGRHLTARRHRPPPSRALGAQSSRRRG